MKSITRSELINILHDKLADSGLLKSDVSLSVKELLAYMSESIAQGERIEIRGFGSFIAKLRKARAARNPRTGAEVSVPKKYVPFFSVGKELFAILMAS